MRFKLQWPVRAHLIILVWASILPALLIILSAGYSQQQEARQALQQECSLAMREIASTYTNLMMDTRRLLDTTAEMPAVRDGRLDGSTGLLTRLMIRNPQYNTLQITNASGLIRASGSYLPQGVSVADRKYFQDTLKRRTFSAGEYIMGRTTRRAMINFAAPILDEDGQLTSVVQAGYDLTHLVQVLRPLKLPEGATVVVCDHAGRVLARLPETNAMILGQPDDPSRLSLMVGEAGEFSLREPSGNYLVHYRQLMLDGDVAPYFRIRMDVPTSPSIAEGRAILYKHVSLLLGAGILATLLAWYFGAVLIVRPVQQLADAARSLGAGHPGPRFKFAHPACEFARLTEAFDEMASLLATREQEQRDAAATLRASEQRFRHLLETSMVGFAVIRESRIIYGNHALARMFGLTSATDTLGVTYTDMVAPDDAVQVADRLREREAGETSVSSYEVRYKRADGTTFAALTQSMRLDLPDGPATVAALIDLTEQKHAETERARLEMQLLQSQKMEAVGQLAGGVAHDFNNILTSISGYSELLLMDKSLPERARADLQEIHRAAVRASDLTRQLLAFSRKQVLTPRVLSLESAVRESQKMIQRLIGEDIELRYIANQDGNILADPTQIGQILVNLAVNGRDAMSPGGKLTIETSSVTLDQDYAADDPEIKPGHWMVLSVSDTGSGISPEAQKHLFEPFFTTKAVGRGTGLGLATIYGIVKQSGGFIKVYSEPGTGTTFKIYLPQVFNEITNARPVDELCPRGAETILLVEDEAMVRSTLKRFLTKQGYQIIEAVNGEDGAARFRENAAIIDMLFTDVVMPNKNGWQLYEQLRALRPDLRVLFMSGYTEHQGILHAGVNFISKPCHLAELARRIREILDAPVSVPVTAMSGVPDMGASSTRRYS